MRELKYIYCKSVNIEKFIQFQRTKLGEGKQPQNVGLRCQNMVDDLMFAYNIEYTVMTQQAQTLFIRAANIGVAYEKSETTIEQEFCLVVGV